MRRLMLRVAAIAASSLLLWSVAAVAQTPPSAPIRPHQFFNGLVNGSSGSAVIRMACFGPIRPSHMGHPFAGQTVAVSGPLRAGAGFTGTANSIDATLYFPTSPSANGIHLASFHYYNEPAPVSTELEFPCGGSGKVVFNPAMGGETANAATVSVTFEGQP